MESLRHVTSLAQVIQLAVAPVFLLTGVGAILNVLANRIARIIDRARPMEERLATVDPDTARELHNRLKVLSRRATFINRAIALCVLSGLLVSLVVGALFVSSSWRLDLALPISVAFVIALFSLAVSLVYFLREVFIATASLSFGGLRKTVDE
jgi:pilus assembly protein TadC